MSYFFPFYSQHSNQLASSRWKMSRRNPESVLQKEDRSDKRLDHPRLSVNSNSRNGNGESVNGWEPHNRLVVFELCVGIRK